MSRFRPLYTWTNAPAICPRLLSLHRDPIRGSAVPASTTVTMESAAHPILSAFHPEAKKTNKNARDEPKTNRFASCGCRTSRSAKQIHDHKQGRRDGGNRNKRQNPCTVGNHTFVAEHDGSPSLEWVFKGILAARRREATHRAEIKSLPRYLSINSYGISTYGTSSSAVFEPPNGLLVSACFPPPNLRLRCVAPETGS